MIPAREGDLPPGPFRVTGLPLPSARGALVDAVPHLVGWDPARQLWYADIVIDPGNAYAPFVKLALSRYQPVSAPGSHLSAVTTTEVMQLLPDRLAVLTRIEPLRYRVALYGHGPRGRVRPVEFAVELLARHAGTDLGWEPLPDVIVEPLSAGSPLGRTVPAAIDEPSPSRGRSTPSFARGSEALGALAGKALLAEAKALLAARRFGELIQRPDLIELLRPPLLNDAALRLPRAPQPGERFRLVITELDVRSVDKEHLRPRPTPQRDPRRHTVYVETFELESDLEDGHEHRTD